MMSDRISLCVVCNAYKIKGEWRSIISLLGEFTNEQLKTIIKIANDYHKGCPLCKKIPLTKNDSENAEYFLEKLKGHQLGQS